MDIVKVLIEFIITFIVIYLVYYLLVIRKCKKDKKLIPTEVNLILSYYEIDLKKIDVYRMVKVVSFVTTLIISVIITLISIFFDSTIILLIFGTLISLVVAVICYRMIGSHYEKISKGKKDEGKKIETKQSK